ncbi:2-hydroxyacid dehydrogenase [Blautia sp. Marseille-P3201T]|uniref:2-hydroxyacid dehydrogenase n=1 Tax=Blautia sp. Marseille-P3201T TaxID=1907659 RepID=UPI00093151AE|nr:2-hydroxyacid dehydrogenase [Blautia sp. Marseille-P3201T]
MKLVIIEPLGVEKEKLLKIAKEKISSDIEIVYYDTKVTDAKSLIERGKDADILVVANLPLSEEVIEECEKLKLLSVAFTGVDHIPLELCKKKGICVCNCAGYSTAAVSDLVFGMLISLYRNIAACDHAVRQEGTKDGLVGFELEGKKFGVVGAGAIGTRVAHIAKAFGCEVYAYSRTKKEIEGVNFVSLQELLSVCDIVSLHVPLNGETTHLIDKEKLVWMKENAVLINTARGPVVDSEALAEALNEGKIAGACVDVFEKEPPVEVDHPLFHAKNILVTPHVAFATEEAMVKRAHIAFENVRAWENGKPQNVM